MTIAKYAFILAATLGSVAFAKDGAMKADKQKVDESCKDDAMTAGCGDEKVGTGLMKCLHEYKMKNKDYKFSEGCKSAMMKMHKDHKEMKEMKK